MPRKPSRPRRFRRLRTERLEDRRLLSATDPRGLSSQWYDGVFDESIEAERIDQEISFRWGEGGPGRDVANDFSARWTGTLTPPRDDDYTFTLRKAPGDIVSLAINGTLLIDAESGSDESATSVSGTISLTVGQTVPIDVSYTNPNGAAELELRWKGNATPDQVVPARYLSTDATESLVPGVNRQIFAEVRPDVIDVSDFHSGPTTVQVTDDLNTNWLRPDGTEHSNNVQSEPGLSVHHEGILRPTESGWYQFGVDAVGGAHLYLGVDGRSEAMQFIAGTQHWTYHDLFQDPPQISEPIYLHANRDYPFSTNAWKFSGRIESRFHWRLIESPHAARYSTEPEFEFIPSAVLYQSRPTVSIREVQAQAGTGESFAFSVDLEEPLARDLTVELTVSNSDNSSIPMQITVDAFEFSTLVELPAESVLLGQELELKLVPTPNVRLDVPSKQSVILKRTDPDEFIEGEPFDLQFTRFNNRFNAGRFEEFVDPENDLETYRFSQTEDQDHVNRLIWNEDAPTFAFQQGRVRFQARALGDVARMEVWTRRNEMAVRSSFDISNRWRFYEADVEDLASTEVWLTLDEINKSVEVRDLSLVPLHLNDNFTGNTPKTAERPLSIPLQNANIREQADHLRRKRVRSLVVDAAGVSVPGAEVNLRLTKHSIDSHATLDDAHFQNDAAMRLTKAIVDEYFTGSVLTEDAIGWKAWTESADSVRSRLLSMLDSGDLTLKPYGSLSDQDIPTGVLDEVQRLTNENSEDEARQFLSTSFQTYVNAILDEVGQDERVLYWESWLPLQSRLGAWRLLSDQEIGELITSNVEKRGFGIRPMATASGAYRFGDVISQPPHAWDIAGQELVVTSNDPLPRPSDLLHLLNQSPDFVNNRILSGFNIRFESEFAINYLASLIEETVEGAMALPLYSMISPGLIWDGAHGTPLNSGLWFSQDWVEGPAAKAWADLWLTEYADQSRMHTGVDGVAETRLMKGEYEMTVTLPTGETITRMIDTEDPMFDTGTGVSVIPVVVNSRPIAASASMATSLGGRLSLSAVSGEMVVDDHEDDQLMATVTALPSHGQLIRDEQPLAIGDGFVWQDLVRGKIEYEQTIGTEIGAGRQDTFSFAVVDALGLQAEDPAEVLVDIDGRSPHQNWTLRQDVNNDMVATALDALLIINHLSRVLDRSSVLPLPTNRNRLPNYVDVNGDGQVTALDALQVINYMAVSESSDNQRDGEAELIQWFPIALSALDEEFEWWRTHVIGLG